MITQNNQPIAQPKPEPREWLGSPHAFFIPHPQANQSNAVDATALLLEQVTSQVISLFTNYSDDDDMFMMPDKHIYICLSAISTQLDLLKKSFDLCHSVNGGAK